MQDNYKLEKEYTIPHDTLRDAYRDFQKLYVFPKSRAKTVAFAAAAIAALAVKAVAFPDLSVKEGYLFYLVGGALFALAFKSWYDPHKMRENTVKSVQTLGEPVYRIGIGEGFIDISTVSDDHSNDMEYEEGEEPEEIDDPLPDKTRIAIDENFKLYEYEEYFLIVPDVSMLYILPKKDFSEQELETVRGISNTK